MILLVFIFMTILLILTASIVVPVGSLGKFERMRRAEKLDDIEVDRELYYGEVISLQRVISALLLVFTSALAVVEFGWLIGVVIALVIAVEYGAAARLAFIRNAMTKQYIKVERRLFGFIKKYPKVFSAIGYFTPESAELRLHSHDELRHLVETSHSVLSADEKQRLLSSLDFSGKVVRDVMTPRSVIDAVKKGELLGPLVLDDLHKTGHSRIPVIDEDIDHVVGILHLRDLFEIDGAKKHTSKVESVMDKRVYYIHEDQSLEHALPAFIKTHHHLFVVVNSYRETVGLLSLEDAIESLIGKKIVDEFDTHHDLRAVAERNPRHNNVVSNGTNV